MNIVARLFVVLAEVLFFILALLPIPYVILEIQSGPMTPVDLALLAATVLGYFVLLVVLFGSLALVVENNRSLKRIASLLEAQGPNGNQSGPKVRREPSLHDLFDSQGGKNSSSSGRIEPKL
jgi:hypothetical protein